MTEYEKKAATEKSKRRQVGRSPAYPYIDLEKALERAEALRLAEGKYEAPITSAYDAWGLGHKSSGARQTAAALRYYGLIDVSGDGDNRRVKVSDVAWQILMNQRDDKAERNNLIRESALMPAIHQHLAHQYPDGLPSDANVKHHLMFEKRFNEKSSDDVLRVFKATALYAGLFQSANMFAADNGSDDPAALAFSIGDVVNWESGGQVQWAEPRKVIGVDQHEGQFLYKVEGPEGNADQIGWIPVEQATPHEGPKAAKSGNFAPPPPDMRQPPADDLPQGSRKAIFPVSEGDVTLIFPKGMSKDALAELDDYLKVFLQKEKRKP